MLTSSGTAKRAHTILLSSAGLLNLFWGVLIFKKKAEKALQASGIPYVIVRPGGMERPTDAYKRTHNVKLATRDQLFGGQVSRLQVAELIAAAVSNPDIAENKVSFGRSEHVPCASTHVVCDCACQVQYSVRLIEGSETVHLHCILGCICTTNVKASTSARSGVLACLTKNQKTTFFLVSSIKPR